jgi:hypothetical protein
MPVFDKEKSKIKMVINTKHGYENKVWYSPCNQDRRNEQLVIRDMITRFKRHELCKITNVLQFYMKNVMIHQERL